MSDAESDVAYTAAADSLINEECVAMDSDAHHADESAAADDVRDLDGKCDRERDEDEGDEDRTGSDHRPMDDGGGGGGEGRAQAAEAISSEDELDDVLARQLPALPPLPRLFDEPQANAVIYKVHTPPGRIGQDREGDMVGAARAYFVENGAVPTTSVARRNITNCILVHAVLDDPSRAMDLTARKIHTVRRLHVCINGVTAKGPCLRCFPRPVKVGGTAESAAAAAAAAASSSTTTATETETETIPLTQPTETHLQCLTAAMTLFLHHSAYTPELNDTRDQLRSYIERIIRSQFRDNTLCVSTFGSSRNNFGVSTSDLDMAVTGPAVPSDKSEQSRFLRRILPFFRREFTHIQPILHAKVPILRFQDPRTHLEGDISCSNGLALRNTELMRTYSLVDPRVRPLAYFLKHLVKKTHINDASQSTLSSYAYLLLLIHFLQRNSVLPYLQRLSDSPDIPIVSIAGFNTYFHSDLSTLERLWRAAHPSLVINTDSIGRLFIDFFHYYAYEFDWRNDVVCIRQGDRLTKDDKMWDRFTIAIEDPFDLTHNLGKGVTAVSFSRIRQTFIAAREYYLTHVEGVPLPVQTQQRQNHQHKNTQQRRDNHQRGGGKGRPRHPQRDNIPSTSTITTTTTNPSASPPPSDSHAGSRTSRSARRARKPATQSTVPVSSASASASSREKK